MADKTIEQLKEIVAKQVERMQKLTEGTPYASIEAVPDHDVFENIVDECKDTEFWNNFKEISPVLLCFATETDPSVSRERDMCVTGEILKSKGLLEAIQQKLKSDSASSLNLADLAVAVKTLQDKVDVITALKEPDSDPAELRFDLKGTNKKVKVDIKKLQEAIKFVSKDGEESKEGSEEKKIDIELTDDDSNWLKEHLGVSFALVVNT